MRSGTKLGIWGSALVCVAAAFAVPASPEASARVRGHRALTDAFKAQGSRGYTILALPAADEDDGFLQLLVERKGARVSYVAPASVTPTSIRADLGDLGQVALDFRPSGAMKTTRSACGRAVSYEAGSWEGSFTFRGEEGYTEASFTSAPALLKPVLDAVCPGHVVGEVGTGHSPGAELRVVSTSHRHNLVLEASESRPSAAVRLSASVDERRGEVLIEREVWKSAPATAFSVDSMLGAASLVPPPPFSGRADFRRRPGHVDWTGNLSVDFPGESDVSLTGAGAHVSLVHAKFTGESNHR